jgi:hypothetical protein
VVVVVSVAAGEAAVEFDDSIYGLRDTIVGPSDDEVGQERIVPAAQGPADAGSSPNAGQRGHPTLTATCSCRNYFRVFLSRVFFRTKE